MYSHQFYWGHYEQVNKTKMKLFQAQSNLRHQSTAIW